MTPERLNIYYGSSDWRGKALSNLSDYPFWFGGIFFKTLESFIQGTKIPFGDPDRETVFAMNGLASLKFVRKKYPDRKRGYVYWGEETIVYNCDNHRLLIAAALGEKIRQNLEVREALLATKSIFIYHDVGPEDPDTSFPEPFYIDILLAHRKFLERLHRLSL